MPLKSITAILIGTLSGCVLYYPTGQLEADTAVQNIINTPSCYSPAECTAKWRAAQHWVSTNIGRPLKHIRDDYIETEEPFPGSRSLAARVTKVKLPDNSQKIVATVWCNSPLQCDPLEVHSIANFNHDVNESWPPEGQR